jgi:hypothetical protein
MWLQLNRFFLMVKSAAESPGGLENPQGFFEAVKQASHLFTGVSDATMGQGEAWHFARLGRMLERADKTSRILDVKYFLLLRSTDDVGTPFDGLQWAAVLRSASAFEMYRKRHGRISPKGVVDFLMLDREFPRAIQFCLRAARDSLHAISGTPLGFTLVEGGDLTVRDRRVWLKTLEGLRPVDVILRLVADAFCDPLALRGDSLLGVPGLVEATRAGRLSVANALGSGLEESPAFLPFLPALATHLLGEELRLCSSGSGWPPNPQALPPNAMPCRPTCSCFSSLGGVSDLLTHVYFSQVLPRVS